MKYQITLVVECPSDEKEAILDLLESQVPYVAEMQMLTCQEMMDDELERLLGEQEDSTESRPKSLVPSFGGWLFPPGTRFRVF